MRKGLRSRNQSALTSGVLTSSRKNTGGALPVLEFTLTKLWETQRHKTMTFTGYHQMEGVRGALNRFADEKTAQLTDTNPDVLDRVLLRLVHTPIGGVAGSAQVFDAATGVQLARLNHGSKVNAVAFSPDGTRVVTVSIDGSVRAFVVTPGLLAQQAFEVMTRPLNSAELRWYSLPSDCRHVEEWNRRNKQHRPPVSG